MFCRKTPRKKQAIGQMTDNYVKRGDFLPKSPRLYPIILRCIYTIFIAVMFALVRLTSFPAALWIERAVLSAAAV